LREEAARGVVVAALAGVEAAAIDGVEHPLRARDSIEHLRGGWRLASRARRPQFRWRCGASRFCCRGNRRGSRRRSWNSRSRWRRCLSRRARGRGDRWPLWQRRRGGLGDDCRDRIHRHARRRLGDVERHLCRRASRTRHTRTRQQCCCNDTGTRDTLNLRH
jgi:hypothetical protein